MLTMVYFWAFMVRKWGVHFAHFGLELGVVFKGTTEAYYEDVYHFNSK